MLSFLNRSRRAIGAFVSLASFFTPAGRCNGQSAPDQPVPAEEVRLGTTAFRAGLQQRGLTDLLELHIHDFPPQDETQATLMMRELKLAEAADRSRSPVERLDLIAEADRMLEQVIAQHPDDPHRFEWRFTLAHSLLYDEAAPSLTSVLYRGGSREDRRKLRTLTEKAVSLLVELLPDLDQEYDRIDRMTANEFERLEADGYVDRLDALHPRAAYVLLWAWLYDAVPRSEADPVRIRNLTNIVDKLAADTLLLESPHRVSRVQVQALLLAGMTYRRLNRTEQAHEKLDRSLQIARSLDDPAERRRIAWAETLASIELIRNETQADRFEEAMQRLDDFRARIEDETTDPFGLEIVAVLLERSVLLRQAKAAENDGEQDRADRFTRESWRVLERLAARRPDRRGEVYATLYDLLGAAADPAALDPFEHCALIAGLLSDAAPDDPAAERTLRRVIAVGEAFLAEDRATAPGLVPEVLFNVGVAEYRLGRTGVAAGRFLEAARDHPDFADALRAAKLAVQLAAQLDEDSTPTDRSEAQSLYRDALELLLTRYTDSDAARYWRFYYAQLLDELGEYLAAADQYALVDTGHEQYVGSVFAHARMLALFLQRESADDDRDSVERRRRTNDFLSVQRRFVSLAKDELANGPDADRAGWLRGLLAEARVLAAEVQVSSPLRRPDQVLDLLSGFESTFPDEKALVGRVWRVRLLAYQRLGKLDEAGGAIPAYIAADPDHARDTLQSLYASLANAADAGALGRDDPTARRNAEMALALADQVYAWANRYNDWHTVGDRRDLTVQLAEANLRAGRFTRARDLFREVTTTETESEEPRVAAGMAEAAYQLGEYAVALPRFNRLATSLPQDDPQRWHALLRDLQCRTQLGERATGIIKVIEQQRYFHPDLGGPRFAPEFEKLKRLNQRRSGGA